MAISPTEADVGRGVVYVAYPGADAEDGVITSVRGDQVWVRYRTQHPSASGQNTPAERLTFLSDGSEAPRPDGDDATGMTPRIALGEPK